MFNFLGNGKTLILGPKKVLSR